MGVVFPHNFSFFQFPIEFDNFVHTTYVHKLNAPLNENVDIVIYDKNIKQPLILFDD